jgi:hypothetical protein
MKKIATAVTLMLGLAFVSTGSAQAAEEVPGTSPENPIVVTDPAEVPEGAVEDEVSTYETPEACDTTRSWVLTIPANEETSHEEFRFLKEVPAVEEQSHTEYQIKRYVDAVEEVSHTEYRFPIDQRTYTPGQQETSHQEYKYKKSVKDYKTENKYMYRKYVKGYFENRQGQNKGSFAYELYSPVNGWSGELHHEGEWGQESATDGTGGHNDTTGYNYDGNRKHSTNYEYRKSELIDTRQVENGSHYEYSDWTTEVRGAPWVKTDERKVVDSETVPPSFGPWSFKEFTPWVLSDTLPADPDTQDGEDNLLNLLRVRADGMESKKVVTTEAVDGYWVYYTNPGESTNEADAAWILASEGLGAPWVNHAERTVVDVEAVDAYTLYYVLGGEPSLSSEDASWLLAEQAPGEGWTQFDQRTVMHGDGTPEVVTYYAYTDGAECEKPEGFENTDSSSECVKGDLVTTNSTETGTPVQAEDGSWTVEVTATSSQSVKEDALKCAPKDNPPPNNPPSNVPTSVDAGLSGPTADTQDDNMRAGLLVGGGLLVMLAAGLALTNQRRNGTEK